MKLNIFSKNTTPQAGERWLLQPIDDDPFAAKQRNPVRIIEVREGWVRYWLSSVFPDERKEVGEFVGMYDRVGVGGD